MKEEKTYIEGMRQLAAGIIIMCASLVYGQGNTIYLCENGKVNFISDAPLEIIKADSDELIGVLNTAERSFSFRVASRSFEGFNSSLQRTHFNEDYMESERFPNSTFKGKIIEEVDLSKPGTYSVRAKGVLTIHGVSFDRIIRSNIEVTNNRIDVNSDFTVFIDDHDITIPSILNKKIAEEISVKIKLTLQPR